jgi:hypothetical protein
VRRADDKGVFVLLDPMIALAAVRARSRRGSKCSGSASPRRSAAICGFLGRATADFAGQGPESRPELP